MIGAPIHLPAAELHRFATAIDPDADHFAWARGHLDTGCEECTTVLLQARQRGCGALAQPSWIRPRLIGAAGGSRAGTLADTKLLCGAGPYEIDVLVREFADPQCLEFLGQVTRADSVHQPVPELSLSLVRATAGDVVSSVSTDDFGEFDLTSDPVGAYGLRLGLGEDAPCVLVWDGAA